MVVLQIRAEESGRAWSTLKGKIDVNLSGEAAYEACPTSGLFRSSVLHPLIEGQSIPDLSSGNWTIGFWVHEAPFPVLGRLAKEHLTPGCSVWFGVGMASIVTVSPLGLDPSPALHDFREETLSLEEWTIKNGKLTNWEFPVEGTPNPSEPIASFSQELPPDAHGVVEECRHSLAIGLRRARRYQPDEIPTFEAFLAHVQTLAEEYRSIGTSDLVQAGPEPDSTPSALADAEIEREQRELDNLARRHLVLDRMIQVNSALSYVISQGYRGAPPILQAPGMIQRHSLLGVGRAQRAVQNLVREIENAFEAFSIPSSMMEWNEEGALDGLEGIQLTYSTGGWDSRGLPDSVGDGSSAPSLPKLVYFSGRLGFRETPYSVAAAIHSLVAGEDPNWHLSTMTHEVLHGHVRLLLTMILGEVREGDPDLAGIVERFRNQYRKGIAPQNLLESAQYVLLHYCLQASQFGSLTHQPREVSSTGDVKLPGAAEVIRVLGSEFASINEILVLVLDLYYFYAGDPNRYLASVWRGWSEVPSVMRDLRQYVLRSLLAAAAFDTGVRGPRRFYNARKILDELLSDLDNDEPHPSFRAARRLVGVVGTEFREVTEVGQPLWDAFASALPLVDFGRACLASPKIRRQLFKKDFTAFLAGADVESWQFAAEPLSFTERDPGSVAEFVAWRAAHAQAGNGLGEARAAWLFINCGKLEEP